jgi:hypothetical protein
MSNDLVRYRSYGAARQHRQDLDAIGRREEVTEAWVNAIGHVTRAAIGQHMLTSMVVEQAVEASPAGEREYHLILAFEAQALAEAIRSI